MTGKKKLEETKAYKLFFKISTSQGYVRITICQPNIVRILYHQCYSDFFMYQNF